MHIRDFAERDVGPACEITNHYIRETAIHFGYEPGTAAEFRAMWMKGITASPIYPWLAAEVTADAGPRFAGYAKAAEFRSRAAYRGTAECGLYLAPDLQARGIGTALYRELLVRLRALGYHTAIGGIALPNEASVRLHEKLGFKYVGTFREVGRKFDQWHDVGFWQLML